MRQIWKPLLVLLLAGIMAADVYYDRSRGAREQVTSFSPVGQDLPVGTNVGEIAPDFSAVMLDGAAIRLSDLRGKTVVINVFASWCGPCRLEMPHLVDVYNERASEDVIFIGLNQQESREAVAVFRDEFGITFPLALNEDGSLTQDLFTPIGLPTTWFIDRDGVVRYVYSGAMTREVLESILDDVIAGRQPDPFKVSG